MDSLWLHQSEKSRMYSMFQGFHAAANRYNIRTEVCEEKINGSNIEQPQREGPKMPQWRIKGYLLLGSRCVRNRPLNDSPTSVYKEGASTVANTLETKEASNGQVTNATSVALGNLNH
ncbi:hypothetical protein Tco_1425956, partial [Tanacetum coccineum]